MALVARGIIPIGDYLPSRRREGLGGMDVVLGYLRCIAWHLVACGCYLSPILFEDATPPAVPRWRPDKPDEPAAESLPGTADNAVHHPDRQSDRPVAPTAPAWHPESHSRPPLTPTERAIFADLDDAWI
jgi:hypothetical protein